MKKARRDLSLENPSTLADFRTWLKEHGSTVMYSSNPYEVIRFQTKRDVAVIYKNKHGRIVSMINGAEEAWNAFRSGLQWTGATRTKRQCRAARKRKQILHTLADRDGGWTCIYCGKPLDIETATIEHIVPLGRAGKDNLSNMALACKWCNQAVGSLSVREKIAYAVDKMWWGRGY